MSTKHGLQPDGTWLFPLELWHGQLIEAIERVQATARVRLANSHELADIVIGELGRLDVVAKALEVEPAALQPRGSFWAPSQKSGEGALTIVTVSPQGVRVERGHATAGAWNGRLQVSLFAPGAEPTRREW